MSLRLYAIVAGQPRAPLGLGQGRGKLEVMRVAGAQIVVERGEALPPEPAHLRGYDRVVRRIARAFPAALPFRFGGTVASRAALGALLEALGPSYREALAEAREAVQFTLRVYRVGRAPRAATEILEEGGPGARFLAKKRRRSEVPEIRPLTEAVAPLVRRARAVRHDQGSLLASVYHLVGEPERRRYRATLARAARALEGVRVDVTGPWPVYAFTEAP